jgi:hypothetical protein
MTSASSPNFSSYAILPRIKPPVSCKGYPYAVPIRAKHFCQPMRAPYEEGCLFFSPIDFDFRCSSDRFELRAKRDNGDWFESSSDADGGLSIADVSSSWHEECVATYRARLAHEEIPRHYDRSSPDYPSTLITFMKEEEPFGFFLQVWLGIVVVTQPGSKLFMREPTVTQLADRGFRHLDAIIETDRWHGYLQALLRPTAFDRWISVKSSQPISQGLICGLQHNVLSHTAIDQVPQHRLMDPMRWQLFDPTYQLGRKRGKYQLQMRKLKAWDCEWRAREGEFYSRKANVQQDTVLQALAIPKLIGRTDREISIEIGNVQIAFDDPKYFAFADALLNNAAGNFNLEQLCGWVHADEPGQMSRNEVAESLQSLIASGAFAIVDT